MGTSENESKSCCSSEPAEEKKTGFIGRMINKIDEKMKAKADEKAEQSCCGGDDNKGSGCC